MKKWFVVFACLIFVSITLTACDSYPSDKNSIEYTASTEKTEVSPNWEVIDLELEGSVIDNSGAIGNAILTWEQENPQREIVDMQIIYQPTSASTFSAVTGISIYSRPK